VVSTKKIVPTIAEGLRRVEEYVVPLEEQNMQTLFKMRTQLSKLLITRQENLAFSGRKLHFILVTADLGF
jgi:hypothetical protein